MCSTTFPSAAKEVMADPVHGLPVNSGSVKAPWTCCVSVTVVWFAAAAGVAETTRTISGHARRSADLRIAIPFCSNRTELTLGTARCAPGLLAPHARRSATHHAGTEWTAGNPRGGETLTLPRRLAAGRRQTTRRAWQVVSFPSC